MKVNIILSKRKNAKTGKQEVILRVFHGEHIQMYAHTGIFIQEKHFSYAINRKATEKYGIEVPANVHYCTSAAAAENGYVLYDRRGKIVIKERLLTPDVTEEVNNKNTIDNLITHVTSAFVERRNMGLVFTKDWLQQVTDAYLYPAKNAGAAANKEEHDLFELAEEFMHSPHRKGMISASTQSLYKCVFREIYHYQSFVRTTVPMQSDYTMNVQTLTKEEVKDFRDFLRDEYDLSKEYPDTFVRIRTSYPGFLKGRKRVTRTYKRGEGIIKYYMRLFRSFIHWCRDNDYTTSSAVDAIVIGAQKAGPVVCLTKEQRDFIANYDLKEYPRLSIQRDIFVFQCLIGSRVSDLYNIREDQILPPTTFAPYGVLVYTPIKTRNTTVAEARVPLSEWAYSLIKKYRGKDEQGRLFPFKGRVYYDMCIHKFLKIMGLDQPIACFDSIKGDVVMKPLYEAISSHAARRTFINICYQDTKDPNLVAKMSGHVDGSRAFGRYRKVEDDATADIIMHTQVNAGSMLSGNAGEGIYNIVDSMTDEEKQKMLLYLFSKKK